MTTLSNEQLREVIRQSMQPAQSIYADPRRTPYKCNKKTENAVNSIMQLFASQRQAILKEVREGFYHKIRCTTVSGSNVIKNGQYFEQKDIDAHLDAIEKKYKGGEETPKEKI